MLNLVKTKSIGSDLNSYRPKIVVNCDSCGVEKTIVLRVKSALTKNVPWECPKCVSTRNSVKEKLAISTKQKWQSNDYKDARSASSSKLWHDQAYIIKHRNGVLSKESRAKCSDAARKAWKDPLYRQKHAAALVAEGIRRPSTEIRFDEILKSQHINYKTGIIIGPYTFDYAIELANKTLLIEVNGNYWHTRPQTVKKDRAKQQYIASLPQYELKTIWESQLFDINKLTKMILRWTGKSTITYTKFELNDIIIDTVEYDKANSFMANYHYLGGAGRHGIAIGGLYNDILICCAVLAHPTRRESYTSLGYKHNQILELTRFCISPYYYNKNMASYFLAKIHRFVSNNINAIISFSDPSQGHSGTIYKAANWQELGETSPSYFYINSDGWKLHKKTLWNKARAMHLSEAEFASQFGYEKIHTPPLHKFIYRISK